MSGGSLDGSARQAERPSGSYEDLPMYGGDVESRLPSGLIQLCDVTLRDGEQAVDAAFTPQEKLRLVGKLEKAGLHKIQVGYPRIDGADTLRLIKESLIETPIQLLCPAFGAAWQEDIDTAWESGADDIHLIMRSADELLTLLGHTRSQAISRVQQAVRYAVDQGAGTVSFGASFATQAEPSFLLELLAAAASAGANKVGISDTLGVATPARIKRIVQLVRDAVDVPVGVHCHNDFGLAVACTLAGFEGGATWADVSVNGLGERSGNASLEEVVLALRVLYSLDIGIATEGFHDLCHTFSSVLGRAVPPDKPVVGDNAFAQKLDIHVKVAGVRPELMEPYDPASVGGVRHLRLGKGSGPHAVRAKLHELGSEVHDDAVDGLVRWVNLTAERTKGFVTDAELLQAVDGVD